MFQAFDKALAEVVDFVADDVQNGINLVREKGVIRAVGDEIQLGVELSVNVLEKATLAGCAGPCKPPEKVQMRKQDSEAAGRAAIRAEDLAARLGAIRKRDPASAICFDCGANDVQMADLSFGVFICGQCCSRHASPPLATHVRHCSREPWSEQLLRVLEQGGNGRLLEFMQANHIPNDARTCYFTPAVLWYREAWLRCNAAGWPAPSPPEGIVPPLVSHASNSEETAELEITQQLDFDNIQAIRSTALVGNASQHASLTTLEETDLLQFDDVKNSTWEDEDLLDLSTVDPFGADPPAIKKDNGEMLFGEVVNIDNSKSGLRTGNLIAPPPAPNAGYPVSSSASSTRGVVAQIGGPVDNGHEIVFCE